MNRARQLAVGLLAGVLFGSPLAQARVPDADAGLLLARHAVLRDELADNAFQRPLILVSSAPKGRLQGDAYARIDRPFAMVRDALGSVGHWCDILILHLNVKGCRASAPQSADMLSLYIGRKTEQALADAHRFDFGFTRRGSDPEYLHLTLVAASGPVGTSDYRIVLEAVALDADRSFIHMSYSYAYGFAAKLAMGGYLATSGRGKVGFSAVGLKGGMRGVVERNTMRYYLAIEAYLGALASPPAARAERRIDEWFTSIERYPLQLHEVEREAYLDMKRREIGRQDALGPWTPVQ
jgi:hypothetical protein